MKANNVKYSISFCVLISTYEILELIKIWKKCEFQLIDSIGVFVQIFLCAVTCIICLYLGINSIKSVDEKSLEKTKNMYLKIRTLCGIQIGVCVGIKAIMAGVNVWAVVSLYLVSIVIDLFNLKDIIQANNEVKKYFHDY